ncbi:caspase-1-like isoform X1 [Amblyomma americanum]
MAHSNGSNGDSLQTNGRNGEQANGNSQTDARTIFGGMFSRPPPTPQHPVLRTALNAEEYSMTRQRRGKCVIFNYKCFDRHTGLCERTGTDLDADTLSSCFQDLGFEPVLHTDLSCRDTKKELQKLGEGDYTDDDCFICCFLTHGGDDVLYTKDGKIPSDSIMEPFRGDVCPSLVGKPKLFFVQACRGDRYDPGADAIVDTSDSPTRLCRIPTHADFLTAYSSVPGFYSWRNESHGSWFIQGLCSVLREQAQFSDLLSMLTVVCRLVAIHCESYVPNEPSKHRKKQVPFITSSLTRLVNFRQ